MEVNHSEDQQLQQQQQQPIPISAQFSAAAIHETAAKLKLLAATSNTTTNNNGATTPAPLASSATPPAPLQAAGGDQAPGGEVSEAPGSNQVGKVVRYRECLKNHAANIGGNALDGCGEFMPCGEEGTLDSLRCAACDCHRNFHRREVEGEASCECQRNKLERKRALASMMSSPEGMMMEEQQHHQHQHQVTPGGFSGGGTPGSMSTGMKKRFRTKFSGEQKERMFSFAEKLGWKIQKHDEAEVQQFCNETGVKRHVLKVWMHNNKHSFGSNPRKAP